MRNESIIENLQNALAVIPQGILANMDINNNAQAEYPNFDTLKKSAVLIPLIIKQNTEISVLFTRRSMEIKYPGAWCFPGGHIDEVDEKDPVKTAIRETFEEVGISPKNITPIGALPTHHNNEISIAPIIGIIKAPFTMKPDPDEVIDTMEVPLRNILNKDNYELRTWYKDNNSTILYDNFNHKAGLKEINIRGITTTIMNGFRDFAINHAGALDWHP